MTNKKDASKAADFVKLFKRDYNEFSVLKEIL